MHTRRRFLTLAAGGAAGMLATACGGRLVAPGAPAPEPPPRTPSEREAARLLRRFANGPRPGDVARVAAHGPRAWLDRQLEPASVDDPRAERLARRVEAVWLAPADVYALTDEEAVGALRRASLLRAVYSERQVQEVAAAFWADHFNVYAGKPNCGRLAILHDRDAIRPHALGRFRDLLRAAATGPAMLVYLDGRTSRPDGPNENFARELLELHTLGIGGGYTQSDVREAARALTGWRVRDHLGAGTPFFDAAWHDAGEKRVLGTVLPAGGGADEVDRLIDVVAAHPSTAAHVSARLCRRFVGDDPPAPLVRRVAERFARSGGDVRETLREIAASEEMVSAPPKLRRPLDFAVAALRALGAETDGGVALQERLRDMGQLPFDWPAPDGFPEAADAWRSRLLPRWRFAFDLTSGALRGTSVDLGGVDPLAIAPALLGRDPRDAERRALLAAEDPGEAVALLLASPAFQYR